jgi:hypothetical protein
VLTASTTYYVNFTGQGFQSADGHQLTGDMYKTFTTRAADEPGMGTIIGQVTDEDGNPIAGATVTVEGTDITATTNETGWYVLENVPEGDHTLVITHPDYDTQEMNVTVTEGETETPPTEQLPPATSDHEGASNWTWIIIIIVIVIIVVLVGAGLFMKGKKPSAPEEREPDKGESTPAPRKEGTLPPPPPEE